MGPYAIVLGAGVSPLDTRLLVHRPTCAFPGHDLHQPRFGFGLWRTIYRGSMELILVVMGAWLYWRLRAQMRQRRASLRRLVSL